MNRYLQQLLCYKFCLRTTGVKTKAFSRHLFIYFQVSMTIFWLSNYQRYNPPPYNNNNNTHFLYVHTINKFSLVKANKTAIYLRNAIFCIYVGLKALDSIFSICQRPVFSLRLSQHRLKITNLKILGSIDHRICNKIKYKKNTLVDLLCVLPDA